MLYAFCLFYLDGLGSTVKCKRNYSDYTLPYKSTPAAKQKTIVQSAACSNQEQSSKKEQDLNENVYIYREGMVPPSRQMFYQVHYNFFIIAVNKNFYASIFLYFIFMKFFF